MDEDMEARKARGWVFEKSRFRLGTDIVETQAHRFGSEGSIQVVEIGDPLGSSRATNRGNWEKLS